MRKKPSSAAGSGEVTLSGDGIDAAVAMPGAPGTYCGSRFSWAGIISRVECGGRSMFGPWRHGKFKPDFHDNVSGTAGEFGMGIAGMPAPLGFEETPAGGQFVKIGVGILRKPDDLHYSFSRAYEIIDSPSWQIMRNDRLVEMRQSLSHDGYGYDYTHRIELVPGRTSFITSHKLRNTGGKIIRQTHYSHNFTVLDGKPVGPAYEVVFPFAPGDHFGANSPAFIEKRTLKFREPLSKGGAVFAQLSGFNGSSASNWAEIRNSDAGVSLHIKGDRPVSRYHFFASGLAVCPEPFVEIVAAPGETVSWLHQYDFSIVK